MIKINENYLKLTSSYLFAEIARRVEAFRQQNPQKEIIRLGIGDVTKPLPRACVDAFRKGVDEMGEEGAFRGYGPEQGYGFLREQIARCDFQARKADISADEVFVSDGAKCDTGNIQELFAGDIVVAVPDPVYPVYVDTNVMAGRTEKSVDGRYGGLVYLEGTPANGFVPAPPNQRVDLIYLCYPNNPTGATATREQLKAWVDYARAEKALILFDAAYESFISDPSIPHSIYEIEGARDVAIEFRSFSKTAGFTGARCAFTVVPKSCVAYAGDGTAHAIHGLWNRRHTTKFNGVSYPVQRAAEAVYLGDGPSQVREIINCYMANAKLIKDKMSSLGYSCTGGVNAPYIWIECKSDSWKFFDMLLNDAGVVCTPGAGFGRCGEGFIRISAFNSRENVEKALSKIEEAVK
ncbi:MAG: LL-diaminopimelate aminotransferase [Chitinispirillia bacterium]|nr:LL-diaminopimelate aminotransferase [Chitinispirillia bacterium]MCL2267628.1 LL-diaminopimelate aminotransferase [Chitinispirillia bacterium]